MSDLETFKQLTKDLVYQSKSIFPSEMYLFYREARRVSADHIIESGIGHGGSTDYLDRLFPDAHITSIDRGKVEEVRSMHPRIEFIQGDGRWEVLRSVSQSKSKSIAVLIDGPKGWQAMCLATRLLKDDRVKIVAIHDLQSEQTRLQILRHRISAFIDRAYANSHDPHFRETAGSLDADVPILSKYPNGPGLIITC